MGKVAKALGVGVKGHISITIDKKRGYIPGETVVGQANLRVDKPLDAAALVLTVVGMERLKWETTSTSHQGSTTTHTTTHHKQKLELFSSQLVLAPPQQYQPGEYVFPFRCLLPTELPPTLEFRKSSLQDMSNVRAYVDYKLKATVPVPGFLRADLEGKYLIQILPNPSVAARSAMATRSQEVQLLGAFSRGKCDFNARLRSDVLRIGESADIRCKISNQSKKRVRDVASLLYQDIKVTPLKGDGGVREYTKTMSEVAYPGFEAGATSDVMMAPKIKSDRLNEIIPTHKGNLFSIQYRMRVKCSYSLCPSTKVEFPLTILP